MYITVKNNNVGQAYKILTKMLNKDGIFRQLRDRESYTPPSKKRLKKHKLAVARIRKEQRKRDENFVNQESRLVYRTRYNQKK
jgi:small subunit ribosomal protein S21